MTTALPIVVVHGASNVDDVPHLHELNTRAELRFAPDGAALSKSLAGADVLLGWNFSARDLSAAWTQVDKLRWIHWCGAGVDAAMFPELVASNVVLTNARGIFDRAMAEYALGAVLAFAKRMPESLRLQQEHTWKYRLSETIEGKRTVIVGVGSIGRAIGRMLGAVGMDVVGVGRHARQGGDAFARIEAITDLDRELQAADYVVLITPLTESTRGLFDAERFAQMRTSARFINLGRGALVDETALIHALSTDQIAGAALDVFTVEPLAQESPFWDMPNVIVSPHNSGDYQGFHAIMARGFLDNFERFASDQALENVVDKNEGFVP
jgi:phosphoglycerate dehydrogenase-like enzyme